MVMLKFKFPPNIQIQMFDAPPLGLTPVKNSPNCIGTESGKINLPMAKPI